MFKLIFLLFDYSLAYFDQYSKDIPLQGMFIPAQLPSKNLELSFVLGLSKNITGSSTWDNLVGYV